MKKIFITVLFTIIVIMVGAQMVNAVDFTGNLSATSEQINAGDTVKITFQVSNLPETGINALQGKLFFDENVLEYVSMSGLNNWANPSYSEGNFTTENSTFIKTAGSICEITLKVKNNIQATSTIVQISDIIAVDENENRVTSSNITKTFEIAINANQDPAEPGTEDPAEPGTEDPAAQGAEDPTPTPQEPSAQEEKKTDKDTSTAKTSIPKTGAVMYVIPVIIAIILVAFGIIKYNKYKNV